MAIDISENLSLSVAKTNLDFVSTILDGDREAGLNLISKEVHELISSGADKQRRKLMKYRLLRLARFCPWKEVRNTASTLLSELNGIDGSGLIANRLLRPSRFEKAGEYPELDLENKIWIDIFRSNAGRILSTHWALSFHERFLELFSEMLTTLMKSEGPLPAPWRNYLAIMGASRHSCEYIVRFQQEMFLLNGGDPQWLEDPSTIPRKLLAMEELNALLAHTPWQLNSETLKQFLHPEDTKLRWNIQEFLSACSILSTHHALASFIYGLGLVTEEQSCAPDDLGEDTEAFVIDDDDTILPLCFVRTAKTSVKERLRGFQKQIGELTTADEPKKEDWVNLGKLREDGNVMGQEEKKALQEVMEGRPRLHTPISDSISSSIRNSWAETFNRKREEIDSGYADFGNHNLCSPVSHFSWDDHAYALLANYLPEVADCFNEEFQYVCEYSDSCIAGDNVGSTMPVRVAINVYILRLYGLIRDDYNYSLLNKFLTLMHKVFLKKLVCFPERITSQDYQRIREFDGFSRVDMVHYCFIGFECRRTLELQYLLHSLNLYQTKRWDDE